MAKVTKASKSEGATSPPADDRLTQRVLTACDAVGAFIESWGFRSIHGRVWTLLAVHKSPMAQAEIAQTLGVSRSLVSLAVSELGHYGLVRATGTHRNAPYEARMDVWPTITDVIRGREWMLIERARVAFDAALAEAEAESDRDSPYDIQRIRLLLAMTELAQTVLRTVLAVRMPRSLDDFIRWLSKSRRVVARLHELLPLGDPR